MTDYIELAEIADKVLAISDEDERKLAEVLDTLEPDLRFELLCSDFLNAYQIFYYFFREVPTELGKERLILQPAGALLEGLLVEEHDMLGLIFVAKDGEPQIIVSDGEVVFATFSGPSAYREAVRYTAEHEW
jgi:hypothetical protein